MILGQVFLGGGVGLCWLFVCFWCKKPQLVANVAYVHEQPYRAIAFWWQGILQRSCALSPHWYTIFLFKVFDIPAPIVWHKVMGFQGQLQNRRFSTSSFDFTTDLCCTFGDMIVNWFRLVEDWNVVPSWRDGVWPGLSTLWEQCIAGLLISKSNISQWDLLLKSVPGTAT